MGERTLALNADRQQIVELLFASIERVDELTDELAAAMHRIEEHARELEAEVGQRVAELERERSLAGQRDRLAAMGEMLAGVAHELNNPRSVVLGQALLLGEAAAGGPLGQRAERITRAAERCARIVRNFLALARQRAPERQETSLNGVVAEVLENLVSNAHHAMRAVPAPRQLSIETTHDAGRGRVILAVADSGPGIPPEVLPRLFEPFFTTKPQGQGTGLGLALRRGLVESNGGVIVAESEPGGGARFAVEIPVTARPGPPPAAPAPEARPIRGRRILVVDDEPEIASLLADILAVDGHLVDVAANGAMALGRLAQGAYDMVLTDLRMPVLDGPGLYGEIEKRYPGMARRVAVVTGDTLGAETQAFLERARLPALAKPFTAAAVREVLGQVLRGEKP